MGIIGCLKFDVGVEHPLAVNDLQLKGAFKVRGEGEGGGASGDDDGIDDLIVLIHQLQYTAVTRRLERQHVTVYIYGRREDGGFGARISRLR